MTGAPAAGLALCLASAIASAVPAAPVPITPATLQWRTPPDNPSLRAAWVVGAPSAHGAYVLRVMLAAGGRIPPHTHPDERCVTVLAGTVYVGFGTTVREADLVAMPAGTVYVVPAGMPHYLVARDIGATYQESGVGPTATTPTQEVVH